MLPMMLQNLMLALVAVADAFMLGGMHQNYMSAVFACHADSVYPEYASFCCNRRTGDSRGTVLGQGNIKTLDDIFCMALRLCGLVSIAFFIACICFPQYLMLFLRMNRY